MPDYGTIWAQLAPDNLTAGAVPYVAADGTSIEGDPDNFNYVSGVLTVTTLVVTDPVDAPVNWSMLTDVPTTVAGYGITDAATDAELAAHTNNVSNPHSVTAAQVGAYTVAETDTLVTGAVGNISGTVFSHIYDLANPHDVTAAQIGAYTSGQVDTLLGSYATSASLSSHTGAASAHGVTGSVVGTSDSQTLTNKTLTVSANSVVTAASGNLAATELNAALAELQGDIDTRATSAAVTAHTSASSNVHGISGAVVGTTDTQALSNKTLTSPILNGGYYGTMFGVAPQQVVPVWMLGGMAFLPAEGFFVEGWADRTTQIVSKATGAGRPDYGTVAGNMEAYLFDSTTVESIQCAIHINHDYKPGSPIYLHVHWLPVNANAGNVVWGFEYTIAKGFGQEAFTPSATTTVTVTQSTASTAYNHLVAEIADSAAITSVVEPDTMIWVRLFRDASNVADTYGSDAAVLTIDAHYKVSRLCTPSKAPNFNAI